jgi:hypothetical protein
MSIIAHVDGSGTVVSNPITISAMRRSLPASRRPFLTLRQFLYW